MSINIFKAFVIKNFTNKFIKLKPEVYVFAVSSFFYIALWIINPTNKIIVASYFILYLVINLKLKDFRLSLLVTFLLSLIVFTGKTYSIQLIPPGIFPKNLYPDGHVLLFIISIRHVIAVLMAFILLSDVVKFPNKFNLSLLDKLLCLYFFWIIFTDLCVSNKPEFSLLYSLASLDSLIMYLYIRFVVRVDKDLKKMIFWVIISMALFQCVISLQQFVYSAPTHNNLEYPVGISDFGSSPDELPFRFRPMGTFMHTNILAAWLAFYASIIFPLFYRKFSNFILGVYFVVLTILVLTLSRGAWLGYSASVFFTIYLFEKLKQKRISKTFQKVLWRYLILGILMSLFFVLPRLTSSINAFIWDEGGLFLRSSQIMEIVEVIKMNPVFGVGSQMSIQEAIKINPSGVYSQAPLTVHNWHFLVMAEHGIPALAVFLIIFITFLRRESTNILESRLIKYEDYMKIGFFSGMISIFIVGLFQPFLIMAPIFLFFGLFQDV